MDRIGYAEGERTVFLILIVPTNSPSVAGPFSSEKALPKLASAESGAGLLGKAGWRGESVPASPFRNVPDDLDGGANTIRHALTIGTPRGGHATVLRICGQK